VGQCPNAPNGYWIGITLDEPYAKGCDGKYKGKPYFECNKGFGKFVRPNEIRTGDFPPFDDFDSEDDEI
jgi:tubulin-folding cofactor B